MRTSQSASVVKIPRRFISACDGSWFSYRPTGEECQTSTFTPAIGRPSASRTRPLKKSASPGTGERSSVPPFSTCGAPARQNGPRLFAWVGCVPLAPLLSRHTRFDTPSAPAISIASLWLAVVCCPIALTSRIAAWNSRSFSRTSRTNACRCRTRASRISFVRASGVRCISAMTARVTSSWVSMIMGTGPGVVSTTFGRASLRYAGRFTRSTRLIRAGSMPAPSDNSLASLPGLTPMQFDTYLRYDDLTRALHGLAAAHPGCVRIESIGKSFEGRDIWLATTTSLRLRRRPRQARALGRRQHPRDRSRRFDGVPLSAPSPRHAIRHRRRRDALSRHARLLRLPAPQPRRRGMGARRRAAGSSARAPAPTPTTRSRSRDSAARTSTATGAC